MIIQLLMELAAVGRAFATIARHCQWDDLILQPKTMSCQHHHHLILAGICWHWGKLWQSVLIARSDMMA